MMYHSNVQAFDHSTIKLDFLIQALGNFFTVDSLLCETKVHGNYGLWAVGSELLIKGKSMTNAKQSSIRSRQGENYRGSGGLNSILKLQLFSSAGY